ncbi:PqqD family protein [Eubacterium oxidoreducens]|uniref:Coenzyme PQQ synthesis protein D (PqqD) n=1 Tax=Eubacterium oxidoreducens TaxID=1732 RepID=A0A1G6AV91_EUBOX|nr:PqqD family protein [Eubacterium oxidoreducens]SDB12252.1 Coenzyme PQQ synthesis protein D (PqqD) [Eubacterium oxidoreducens]
MRTNSDFIKRELAGEYILVPTGEMASVISGMITMTQTAAFIWDQYDQCDNLEQIVTRLMEEFDVDEQTAREDVYGYSKELYKKQMIMEVPELEEE